MSSPTAGAQSAKKTLLDRRAKLSRSRADNETDAKDLGNEPRGSERSHNDEIADVLVLLSDRQKVELADLDAALARIDAGTWGRCEKCNGRIAAKRLEAMPEARTCLDCAA